MEQVKLGKIVNTHGIKGELRIISDFEYKDRAFKPNFNLYIDNDAYQIKSYRRHKSYDMVCLEGFDNINQVLHLKGKPVFVNRADLNLKDNFLCTDLIGFQVYDEDKLLGSVTSLKNNGAQILLVLNTDPVIYIPKVDAFIKEVDQKNKKILLNHWEGLK